MLNQQTIGVLVGGAGAAVLAGLFTILTKLMDNKQKRVDRKVDDDIQRREARRDMYVQFLRKSSEVSDLEENYMSPGGPVVERLSRVYDVTIPASPNRYAEPLRVAMGELKSLAFLVELESPSDIGRIAQGLADAHMSKRDVMESSHVSDPALPALNEGIRAMRGEFIQAARQLLGSID